MNAINWAFETLEKQGLDVCDDELTTNEEIAMLIRRQTYDERIEMADYIAMELSLDTDSVAQVLSAYADLVLE